MSNPSNPWPEQQPPARRVKIAHLVFGLVFCGIVTVWALAKHGILHAGDVPVLIPAVLIGAGVLGLVAAVLAGSRGRRRTDRTHHTDTTEHTEEIR